MRKREKERSKSEIERKSEAFLDRKTKQKLSSHRFESIAPLKLKIGRRQPPERCISLEFDPIFGPSKLRVFFYYATGIGKNSSPRMLRRRAPPTPLFFSPRPPVSMLGGSRLRRLKRHLGINLEVGGWGNFRDIIMAAPLGWQSGRRRYSRAGLQKTRLFLPKKG